MPQNTNEADEPRCDDCGLLQPRGTDMTEIQMIDEPDVWVCPGCDREMMKEMEALI